MQIYTIDITNLLLTVLVIIAAVVAVVLLFRKNWKDRKHLRPGSDNPVDEAIRDNARRKDKL